MSDKRDRGTKPTTVPIPKDGIWWVRVAQHRFIHIPCEMHEIPQSYYTWVDPIVAWQLVIIDADCGQIDEFGSDEGFGWDSDWRVVIELGPRVLPPDAVQS